MAAALVFCGGMALAAGFDLRERRIPNALNLALAALGAAFAFARGGAGGLGASALGLLAGMGLLFLPFYFRWFGAGDVKLAGAIGAWLGPQVGAGAILAGLALDGVLSLAVALLGSVQTRREVFANLGWLVLHRRPFEISERPARERVPFAVALGVCAVAAFFLQGSAA